jgi:hypothetical protein
VNAQAEPAIPKSTLELLTKYRWDAQYLSAGHYLAGKRYAHQGRTLGILAITASSVASTSAFASLAAENSVVWKIVTGLLAAGAATFASLQTFLKLGDLAEKHKVWGARFIEIRDDADRVHIQLAASHAPEPDALIDEVRRIADRLATASAESPDLENRDYDRGRAGFAASRRSGSNPSV